MGTTRPAGGTTGAPAVPGSAAGAWVMGAVDTDGAGVAEPPEGDEEADGVAELEQPATTSSSADASAATGTLDAFITTPCPPTGPSKPARAASTDRAKGLPIDIVI